MTPPGQAQDTVSCDQHRRKVVEDVRRIAKARQEEQGWAGTAPVEYLQPHIILDRDKRCHVR